MGKVGIGGPHSHLVHDILRRELSRHARRCCRYAAHHTDADHQGTAYPRRSEGLFEDEPREHQIEHEQGREDSCGCRVQDGEVARWRGGEVVRW